jgi:hypothetical protein
MGKKRKKWAPNPNAMTHDQRARKKELDSKRDMLIKSLKYGALALLSEPMHNVIDPRPCDKE